MCVYVLMGGRGAVTLSWPDADCSSSAILAACCSILEAICFLITPCSPTELHRRLIWRTKSAFTICKSRHQTHALCFMNHRSAACTPPLCVSLPRREEGRRGSRSSHFAEMLIHSTLVSLHFYQTKS